MSAAEARQDAAAADERKESIEDVIIREARRSIERIPMLEVVFERMVLNLVPAIKAFTGVTPEAELLGLEYNPTGAALEAVHAPSVLTVCNADPWDGSFLISIEPDILFSVLEIMLGGRGKQPAGWEPRRFSAIEKRIGSRLGDLVREALESSFASISEVSFATEAVEVSTQSMVLAPPTSPSVTARFKVQIEDRVGHGTVLLPYSTIDEIKPLLARSMAGGHFGADSGWRGLLSKQLNETNVTLTALLHELKVPLGEVLEWQPGQTLELGIGADHQLTGLCQGKPILRAGFGRRRNGALALKVTENLQEDVTEDEETPE